MSNKIDDLNMIVIKDECICGPDFDMYDGVKVRLVSMRDNNLECFMGDEYYKNLKLAIVEVVEDINDLMKGEVGEFLYDDKLNKLVSM